MPQPKILYSCAQQDLYDAARVLTANVQNKLTEMAAYKGKYTTTFCDDFYTQVDEAEALPDFQTRSTGVEAGRILLKEETKKATDSWQDLKGYIEDAFAKPLHQTMLQDAGSHNYSKAASGSSAALRSLLLDATQFIANHQTELTANNNMPVSFKTKMDNFKVNIQDATTAIENGDTGVHEATRDKNNANNAVFTASQAICADGQRIFRDDLVVKEEFTWDKLIEKVAPKVAGYKLHAIDSITSLPMQGVTLMSSDGLHTRTTDAEGRCEFNVLAAGTYTFTYTKDGYTTITKEVVIQPHVTKTETIEMVAL